MYYLIIKTFSYFHHKHVILFFNTIAFGPQFDYQIRYPYPNINRSTAPDSIWEKDQQKTKIKLA